MNNENTFTYTDMQFEDKIIADKGIYYLFLEYYGASGTGHRRSFILKNVLPASSARKLRLFWGVCRNPGRGALPQNSGHLMPFL
jgi:hypothetical protein